MILSFGSSSYCAAAEADSAAAVAADADANLICPDKPGAAGNQPAALFVYREPVTSLHICVHLRGAFLFHREDRRTFLMKKVSGGDPPNTEISII